MEKIKKFIKDGYLNEALNEIDIELGKSFNFKNKKSRKKFIELHKNKRQLNSRLKTKKTKKKTKGKGGIGILSHSGPIINYFLGTNSSTTTRIPKRITENEKLKRKFNELVAVANTKNPIYLELLYILAYTIDETNRLILLLGETGVGKSYLAEKIHYLSDRKNKPFKTIDCGNISENLLESELFGHIKGAYTGAHTDRSGALKSAEGGTLFIDEIHRASKIIRDKLLNYFIHKTYSPMGSDRRIDSDVRIIIGTNKDIDVLYSTGEIENDFYFRIKDRVLEIPPLRKRREDIPNIISKELEHLNKAYNRNIILDKDAIEVLVKYNWPGNYHQLKRYLLDIFGYGDMWGIDTLDCEIIESKPPTNIFVRGENPFVELEESLFRVVLNWNPDEGKFITDLIEPLLANIYVNKLKGTKTQATKYIQIDGSGGVNSTLDKRLNQYSIVSEKLLKN